MEEQTDRFEVDHNRLSSTVLDDSFIQMKLIWLVDMDPIGVEHQSLGNFLWVYL